MTFPEIVESKDLLCGRTCAVDNVRARRKGVLGKLYEIQISPERGLRNSLKFPSYFGMEYVRPWNMGKKLLEFYTVLLVYQRVNGLFEHRYPKFVGSLSFPQVVDRFPGNNRMGPPIELAFSCLKQVVEFYWFMVDITN